MLKARIPAEVPSCTVLLATCSLYVEFRVKTCAPPLLFTMFRRKTSSARRRDDDTTLLLAAFVAVMAMAVEEARLAPRRAWVRSWIARRRQQGMHHNLFMELQLEDPDKFRRCLRMNTAMFQTLLEKVTPLIEKETTHLRRPIPASERLTLTLRHLATGETQESLQMSFRIGQSTICGILRETVQAIYEVLSNEYLRAPSSAVEWQAVANHINQKWNFPNCIGAMDGKHFVIEHPLQSGSMYYNYKDQFSVVLLAVVDAHLRFILIYVGSNGRASDRGIWSKSDIRKFVENLNTPRSPLPNTEIVTPYVIVGDEGFSLSQHLMIPFPEGLLPNRLDRKIFNYRLSRFRRCSENAFGILATRFQIFRSPIRYDPDVATNVILASLALHNWLRSDSIGQALYSPGESIDQEDC